MIIVKTGMRSEFNAVQSMLKAKGNPTDVMVVRGAESYRSMNRNLPKCDGIISIGTCGGLTPTVKVGECYVADFLSTPDNVFLPDIKWANRLVSIIGGQTVHWWSSGKSNTANDVPSRQAIFNKSGAIIIDDESYDVAQFAAVRHIPFAIIRIVSDTCVPEDDVPPAARNAVNANGDIDIFEVIKSLLHNIGQIHQLRRMWINFNVAMAELRLVLDKIGPEFQLK